MSTTPGLSVNLKGLTRVFGSVRALDGLDLQIGPGELVALLGPSGCGKTTALRILAGLDQATAGTVEVDGKDLTRVPANKRDMGMVFQAYSLFPHMTVLENVAFGLKLRGQDRTARTRRAGEVLELVGLGEQGSRYAHQLSGGQQQRVALARALAIEPSVLLLDEPLSALDAKVRAQLRDEIRRVQLEVGITTLFVTHDQEEALAIADRVGVMNAGHLDQIAAPAELYAQARDAVRRRVRRVQQQGADRGDGWGGQRPGSPRAHDRGFGVPGGRDGAGPPRVGDRGPGRRTQRQRRVGQLPGADLTGLLRDRRRPAGDGADRQLARHPAAAGRPGADRCGADGTAGRRLLTLRRFPSMRGSPTVETARPTP